MATNNISFIDALKSYKNLSYSQVTQRSLQIDNINFPSLPRTNQTCHSNSGNTASPVRRVSNHRNYSQQLQPSPGSSRDSNTSQTNKTVYNPIEVPSNLLFNTNNLKISPIQYNPYSPNVTHLFNIEHIDSLVSLVGKIIENIISTNSSLPTNEVIKEKIEHMLSEEQQPSAT